MDKKMMPTMIVMLILMVGSIYYAVQGVKMHSRVAVEEAKFHALQAEYFNNSKELRDGAETGSALSRDLVKIKNYPSSLLELKLVGVGKILTGIFVLLFAILLALIVMPVRLGGLILKSKER